VTTLLTTDGLAAGYNGVPVTGDVSIEVHAGEVVALLGANGAGKTTTLLSICGLIPPLAGTIELFGAPVGRRRRAHQLARAGLAHVPEDRSLFFDLTGREHLRVVRGAGHDAIALAVRYFPALEKIMGRKVGLMSGGEQQMLALARGFVMRPKLLLVDELTLGLAPVIAERLVPTLRELATETGAGVLLVEQHIGLALAAADRAYVMANGRVTSEGPAAELREQRELIASSYLGAAGDLKVKIDKGDG
jgi:branched-chain amino acid transport system ATP-binding protein